VSLKTASPLAHFRLPRRIAIAIVFVAVGCRGAQGGGYGEAKSETPAKRDEPRLRAETEFARAHDSRVAPTLEGLWINIGGSRAYLTVPVGVSAPMAGIVVLHTARGLNRDIQLWTDRLAEEGYAAIAVDLYKGRSADRREEALALRDDANKRPEQNKAVIRGAYEYLASDPRILATRRALVGWSYGAAWATLMASQLQDLNAVVAHYGVADVPPEGVAKIQSSLLLICGDRDEERAEVTAFANSLKTAGKPVQLVWAHADHGFVDPSNANYDGPAAERTYAEVRRFLGAALRR
jgi:carboxymethylenebutenolidase